MKKGTKVFGQKNNWTS